MAKNEPKVYRQGNGKRIFFRVILWILAVILVLLVTAVFGFRKYIAYTDTGKLYLDIPWLAGYMNGPPEYDDLAEYRTPPISDDHSDGASQKSDIDSAPQETASESANEKQASGNTPETGSIPVSEALDDANQLSPLSE